MSPWCWRIAGRPYRLSSGDGSHPSVRIWWWQLASPSDEGPRGLTALRQKMADYQRNGARLGWLLIPQERAVEVWGPLEGGEQGRPIEPATRLVGAPEFPGLTLDLEPVWAE